MLTHGAGGHSKITQGGHYRKSAMSGHPAFLNAVNQARQKKSSMAHSGTGGLLSTMSNAGHGRALSSEEQLRLLRTQRNQKVRNNAGVLLGQAKPYQHYHR